MDPRPLVIYGKRPDNLAPPQRRYPKAVFWGMGRGHTFHWTGEWKWDEWFETHPIDHAPFHKGIIATRPRAWQALRKIPPPGQPGHKPVWVSRRDPRIPAGVLLPYREIEQEFPAAVGEPNRWSTCMMDDILPFSYIRGFRHVIIMGHGVSRNPAHMLAHMGILYWIGVLRGRGVNVEIHEPSWYRAPAGIYGLNRGAFDPAHMQRGADGRRRTRQR